MSAADGRTSACITARTDNPVVKRRRLTVSLGSDPESEVIRAWLAASADQGDESRRIRQALVAGLQLLPHLERIETHLGVLARIEAHLTNAPRSASSSAAERAEDDPLTQAEEAALAALLDTD